MNFGFMEIACLLAARRFLSITLYNISSGMFPVSFHSGKDVCWFSLLAGTVVCANISSPDITISSKLLHSTSPSELPPHTLPILGASIGLAILPSVAGFGLPDPEAEELEEERTSTVP